MSCSHLSNGSEWERRIALYAGGDLRPDEAEEVERVLAECMECAAVAESYRAQRRTLATAYEEAIAPAHYAAVRARVLAELERGKRRTWCWAWVGAVAAAVLVAFALFPRGVRAPERGEQTAVSRVTPRVEAPGGTASTGVSREARRSPAEAGDGTLKRAPRGRGGDLAGVRTGSWTEAKAPRGSQSDVAAGSKAAAEIEPETSPDDGVAAQNEQAPNARRKRQRAVGRPEAETRNVATAEPTYSSGSIPRVAQSEKEPLVIKLFTNDPDVVIYWISEGEGDSQ
jgi:hypothetical protein